MRSMKLFQLAVLFLVVAALLAGTAAIAGVPPASASSPS